MRGATCAHSASVKSLGYRNRLRSYRARFSVVHIGAPPSNQDTPLESQTTHPIQDLSGQTLRFSTLYIPPTFIVGDAAVRNPDADAFARSCEKYTILSRFEFNHVPSKWDWASEISLSFLGAWGRDRSVQIAEVDPKTAISRIVYGVRDKVIPYFSRVRSMSDLYDFLVRGEEPMNWRRCGGPTRMAQIAYLGRALGHSPEDIAAVLTPHLTTLNRIVDPETMPWERYVHTIIADADAALSR